MKYVIITKRGLTVMCFVAIIAVSLFVSAREKNAMAAAASGTETLPVYCVDTDEKKVAVTFDAAWGADDIPVILQTLKKHNAKATFFIVGEWAKLYPEQVKNIFDAGHEIGNHSYNHSLYGKLTKEQITEDLEKCNKELSAITGKAPQIMRFPSGDYSELAVRTVREAKLQPIQWSVDSLDWQGISKQEIIKRVVTKTENGSVILFHNDVKNTDEALDEILTLLENRGYSFVGVSQLIYGEPYRIDAQGKQYKVSQ